MLLEIVHREREGIAILDLNGNLTFGQENLEFRNQLESLIKARQTRVLLNLSELRKLESNLQIKTLEAKSFRAQRLPKVNLVAQYSLLAKYNNFQNYFQRFSRNNVELGASFEIPVLAGRAGAADRAALEKAERDQLTAGAYRAGPAGNSYGRGSVSAPRGGFSGGNRGGFSGGGHSFGGGFHGGGHGGGHR